MLAESDRNPKRVFVVHGRNHYLRRAFYDFLRAIGLTPLEWGHALEATRKGAPFIGEILDEVFGQVHAVVVLLTGDDLAMLAPELQEPSDPDTERRPTPQARPNVLFEAGLALGRLPAATILVQLGIVRPFSDIAGRHIVRLTNSIASRQELASRLNAAGLAVDLRGTDWHTAGDFETTPADSASFEIPSDRAEPVGLHAEQLKVLEFFKRQEEDWDNTKFPESHVAEVFSFRLTRVRYHLAELLAKGLVESSLNKTGEAEYTLSRRGRGLLIELEDRR